MSHVVTRENPEVPAECMVSIRRYPRLSGILWIGRSWGRDEDLGAVILLMVTKTRRREQLARERL